MAVARSQGEVVAHDGSTAAVNEDEIVPRNEAAKRIVGIGLQAGQGRGRIDIPESDSRARRAALDHPLLQQFVVGSHAAVFDDKAGAGGPCQQCINIIGSAVNDHLRIIHVVAVAVLLTPVDIGLREDDVVAQRGKVPVDAAIISRGAVPIA